MAAPCPDLPDVPEPLIDPARAIWELQIIASYGDCRARHKATVEAWPRSK